MSTSTAKIPNNVDLKRQQAAPARAREVAAGYIDWWNEMGPTDFQDRTTSTCAPPSASIKGGWANFDYVKMPDYRWGIFLAEPIETARSTSATTSASRPGTRCPARCATACGASS